MTSSLKATAIRDVRLADWRLVIIAVPPLAALVMVAGFLLIERIHPFGPPVPVTVADAAARGAAARTVELILNGANPSAKSIVPPEILGHDAIELYPIEAAILGRHEELVTLLTRQGATLPSPDRAVCLAVTTHFENVLPLLGTSVALPDAPSLGPGEAWQQCKDKGR